MPEAGQVRERCEVGQGVSLKVQGFQIDGELESGQVRNMTPRAPIPLDPLHVLGRDGVLEKALRPEMAPQVGVRNEDQYVRVIGGGRCPLIA